MGGPGLWRRSLDDGGVSVSEADVHRGCGTEQAVGLGFDL